MIASDRCLGFTQYSECPLVVLDPQRPTVRNFVLKRACQVRVQALDEDGHPVPAVKFFMRWAVNGQLPTTDQEGWATIGGMNPSLSEATFGVYHTDFERTRLHVKLDDPKTVVERKIVIRRGVDIEGTAVCSDGKPAAGWQILALPGWWDSLQFPTGELINGDGSFVLHHVGPGATQRDDLDSDRSRSKHEPIGTPRRRPDESTRAVGYQNRLSVARGDGSYRGEPSVTSAEPPSADFG